MLILGSSSPRRAELLKQLGLTFQVLGPDIDESVIEGESPAAYVTRMSNGKFQALKSGHNFASGTVLICADTVVVLADQILGKPKDEADARQMLQRLSGNHHLVLTSVTVGGVEHYNRQFVVETIVKFRTLNDREIGSYWQTGEPKDKAGAYGIQGLGSVFVERIEGSYSNVVGLPLMETAQALAEFAVVVP